MLTTESSVTCPWTQQSGACDASYKASASSKASQAPPEEIVKRRVLPILGATSACLCTPLVHGEASEKVASTLASIWSMDFRGKVVTASTGQPSRCLFLNLSRVLHAFEILALDPVHLTLLLRTSSSNEMIPTHMSRTDHCVAFCTMTRQI